MFIIRIENSDDPALDLIQSDPDKIFGRPFAGYILLLFGDADEKIATWVTRTMISLDSLTGDDIACIIFASRIRVRSELSYHESTRPQLTVSRGDEVLLEKIRREQMAETLVKNGVSFWDPGEREITAVTYAADEVARKFNVLDQLPCMIFLDANENLNKRAFPYSSTVKEVIPLGDYPVNAIITFLRRIIQGLRDAPGYDQYVADVKQISSLSDDLQFTNLAINRIQNKTRSIVREITAKTKSYLEAIKRAKWAILQGSRKHFEAALSRLPNLEQNLVNELLKNAETEFGQMVFLNRTIGALKYYTSKAEISATDRINLKNIFDKYVRYNSADPRDFSEAPGMSDCHRALKQLETQQGEILDSFLLFLPNEFEITGEGKLELTRAVEPLEQDLNLQSAKLRSLTCQYEEISKRCISPDHPSLIDIVRRTNFNARNNVVPTAPGQELMWDFFIAHSSHDIGIAEELYEHLILHSKVFLDTRCLKLGVDWDQQLREAQKRSKITIVLVSMRTDESYYQREEIASAINLSRNNHGLHKVIPIYLDENSQSVSSIPYGLRLKHGIKLHTLEKMKDVSLTLLHLLHD